MVKRNRNSRKTSRRTGNYIPTSREYLQWTTTDTGTGAFKFPTRYAGRQVKITSYRFSFSSYPVEGVAPPVLLDITTYGSAEAFSTRDIILPAATVKSISLRARKGADFITISADPESAFVINSNSKIMMTCVATVLIRPQRDMLSDPMHHAYFVTPTGEVANPATALERENSSN